MLDRVELAVETGIWSDARDALALFQAELEMHMRLEEELMFPSFEAFIGSGFGPPTVMRAEHGHIQSLLAAIGGLLRDEQPIDEAADALEKLLSMHNTKEERIVYPMFERYAPVESYAAVELDLRRLMAMAG